MIITRPNHDIATNYLYFWSEKIIEEARSKGMKVIDLRGKKAVESEFASRIRKLNPSFVVLNGHGNSDTITGYGNQVLISTKNNLELLTGRVIFSRSCSSAQNLGVLCVKDSGAFIGYDDDFALYFDDTKVTRPLGDNLAKLFLESSNQVAISLIKGHTASDANNRSRSLFRKNISNILTSEGVEYRDALPYLIWDYNHAVCLGDGEATIK